MKFLGNISHLSNSGKLIARSSQSPPSGAFVFDKDKKKIGKVVEVFGPTKEPYISIGVFKSIGSENFKNSSGEDLYVSNNPKNKKKGRTSRFDRNNKNNTDSKNRNFKNTNSKKTNSKNVKSKSAKSKNNKNNKNDNGSKNNKSTKKSVNTRKNSDSKNSKSKSNNSKNHKFKNHKSSKTKKFNKK